MVILDKVDVGELGLSITAAPPDGSVVKVQVSSSNRRWNGIQLSIQLTSIGFGPGLHLRQKEPHKTSIRNYIGGIKNKNPASKFHSRI